MRRTGRLFQESGMKSNQPRLSLLMTNPLYFSVLHFYLQNWLLQLLSSQCCSSQPENSMTPFDTIDCFPLFILYRGYQYGKQLWILRWKQNIHAELSISYSRGLLICAVTFVLGKSQFSMVCSFVSISQTPGALLQLIHTLLGSLPFSKGFYIFEISSTEKTRLKKTKMMG